MRNCLRVVFAVALVLMVLAGIGGGAASAAGTGSINGYVYIEGTTTQLTGVTVTVFNLTGTYVGQDNTGPGGYSVINLADGSYLVMAEEEGYYRQYYDNATTPGGATVVVVDGGDATIGKDFYLTPGKAIKGTVYDNATNPISHAWVEVDDNATGAFQGRAYSTDNGTFSITVAPGTYKVWANAPGYAKEYYSNQLTFAAANPVVLAADNDTTGIDFSLGVSESIAGQVFKQDNVTPLAGATIAAYDSVGGLAGSGASSSENGTYFINLAAPGQYRIVATASGQVPQWWDGHSLAAEPANPLPYWTVADWITVTNDNQTAGCNFRMLPQRAVTTEAANSVTLTAAILNGSLSSLGGSDNVNVSFQWGTDNAYTGGATPADVMTLPGAFNASLAGLSPNTTYHFRAAASGDGLTVYGEDATFTTTAAGVPAVTTDPESDVTTATATLNGSLTGLGTSENVTVSFEWGTTTAYGATTEGVSENATGPFSSGLTSLTPNTTYHFRAVAVGDGTPAYGADRAFTTLGTAPEVTTDNATDVGAASATLKGVLTSLGTEASVSVSFEWRVAGGIWAETIPTQTLTAAGSYTASLTSLSGGTTYYVRAKADGYGAPVYGAEVSFTTTAVDSEGPVVTSLGASGETTSSAIIKWTTDEGATSQVEYGLTNEYGQTTAEDTSLVTSHSVELKGLEAGKTYHYRVVSRDAANNETISPDMTLETEAGSGGVPVWGWVLIGLAAVGVAGGGAALLLRGRAPKPQ